MSPKVEGHNSFWGFNVQMKEKTAHTRKKYTWYTWWKLEQPFCVQVLSSEAKDREPCLPRKYKAPKSQDPERPKCGCEPKKEKEGLNALFPDLSSVSSTRKNRWVGFPQSGIFLIGDHEYGIAWVFFYWPNAWVASTWNLGTFSSPSGETWAPGRFGLGPQTRRQSQTVSAKKWTCEKTNIHSGHFLDFLYFHLENAL